MQGKTVNAPSKCTVGHSLKRKLDSVKQEIEAM